MLFNYRWKCFRCVGVCKCKFCKRERHYLNTVEKNKNIENRKKKSNIDSEINYKKIIQINKNCYIYEMENTDKNYNSHKIGQTQNKNIFEEKKANNNIVYSQLIPYKGKCENHFQGKTMEEMQNERCCLCLQPSFHNNDMVYFDNFDTFLHYLKFAYMYMDDILMNDNNEFINNRKELLDYYDKYFTTNISNGKKKISYPIQICKLCLIKYMNLPNSFYLFLKTFTFFDSLTTTVNNTLVNNIYEEDNKGKNSKVSQLYKNNKEANKTNELRANKKHISNKEDKKSNKSRTNKNSIGNKNNKKNNASKSNRHKKKSSNTTIIIPKDSTNTTISIRLDSPSDPNPNSLNNNQNNNDQDQYNLYCSQLYNDNTQCENQYPNEFSKYHLPKDEVFNLQNTLKTNILNNRDLDLQINTNSPNEMNYLFSDIPQIITSDTKIRFQQISNLLSQNLTNLSIILLSLIKENKERYYNVSLDYYEYHFTNKIEEMRNNSNLLFQLLNEHRESLIQIEENINALEVFLKKNKLPTDEIKQQRKEFFKEYSIFMENYKLFEQYNIDYPSLCYEIQWNMYNQRALSYNYENLINSNTS